jgi:hypothetical protein
MDRQGSRVTRNDDDVVTLALKLLKSCGGGGRAPWS